MPAQTSSLRGAVLPVLQRPGRVPARRGGTAPDSIQLSTWDWEAGQQHVGPHPPGTRPAAAAGRQ
jgi:hypothetical protein